MSINKADQVLGTLKLPTKAPPFGVCTDSHSSYDPHVLFATMHERFPRAFEDRLCGGSFDNIRSFWDEMSAANHPGLLHHDMRVRHSRVWNTKGIPFTIHGDLAPISGLGKSWLKLAEIHSWSSCLSSGRSWAYNFLVFIMYEGLMTVKDGVTTRDRFFKRLAWSLYWAYLGLWPDVDMDGKVYTTGIEAALALKPLAAGYFLVLWCNRGDLDFLRKAMDFPDSKAGARMCACCEATGSTFTDNGTSATQPSWYSTMWALRPIAQWEAAFPDRNILYKVLPSCSIFMHVPDWMHVKNLGSDAEFYGSVLVFLCFFMDLGPDPAAVLLMV